MDIKLLLLKSISTLYYSSVAKGDDSATVRGTITKVLERIDIPDSPTDMSKERLMMLDLRKVIHWMLKQDLKTPIDHVELLSRIEIACQVEPKMHSVYEKSLVYLDEEAAGKRFGVDHNDLLNYLSEEDLVSLLRKASRDISFDRSSIADLNMFKTQLITQLTGVRLDVTSAAVDGSVLKMSDLAAVEEVYQRAEDLVNPDAIIKFPFKALNRMFGEQDGGRRGEYMGIHALAGHNKTGTLLDIFLGACVLNKPKVLDPKKKPLHVYFTIEDPITEIMRKIYVMLMQQEHGLPVDLRGVTFKEQSAYTTKRLTANGAEVFIVDFQNGGSPYLYLNQLMAFEEAGYEIITCGCDYVNLMDTAAVGRANQSENVKGIHRMISDFTKPRNIFHYTAGQLSADAREVMRMYPDDFISRLIDRGYYEGCKTLSTEFDFELYVAKRTHQGITWQEYAWGKHRKLGATDETHKYFAMRFYPVGMIGCPWDYDTDEDHSYKKVGNRNSQGSGAAEWSDFGNE